MYISWHGLSCFKINEKIQSDELTIILDPYSAESGFRALRAEADLVALTTPESSLLDAGSLGGNPKIIQGPGEYEVKGIYVDGVFSFRDSQKGKERGVTTLYQLVIGEITVVHLGFAAQELKSSEIERFGKCDIALVPVGGNGFLNAKQAADVVSQLEPSLIIPMMYDVPGCSVKLDALDGFLKEMGAKNAERVEKLKISKKDLLVESSRVVILEKN